MHKFTQKIIYSLALLLGLSQAAFSQSLQGAPSRIEMHAVQSRTLSGPEFLNGDKGDKPVILAGELRLPQAQAAKFPAIVLVHGSGGVNGGADMWIHRLNQAGIATFVLDTFSGRGIVSTVQDQTQLHSLAMMVDTYKALDLLAKHPRIDASKISVIGFSKGAVASIFSASTRFQKMYGTDAKFASHIGLYTPCNMRFMGDTTLTGAPMRFFHGTSDDYVSVVPCRSFVEEIKQKGVDVALTEYADTQHGYDNPLIPELVAVPTAQSTRNCRFVEQSTGDIVNADTKISFSYADPCLAIGAHGGHNPDSTKKTLDAVIAFLQSLK